ncbi:MAG: hypothetical protein CL811_13345 [Colwelliaceae bacterium]|nr:hypothetical protein [Colwelliaceae bacterium]
MNLKIAHKIIIGFTVILLLLILASVSSIAILANIEKATTQVDQLALPIQRESNAIQVKLLTQAKQASQISSQANLQALEALEQAFVAQGKQLNNHKQQLQALSLDDRTATQLKSFEGQYQSFDQTVQQMFAHETRLVAYKQQLSELEEGLNLHLDEAAALLVDLTYLEDYEQQAMIDRIAGAAGQIEGWLINVTDATKGVLILTETGEVEASEEVILQAIGNIDQQISYLVRLGEDYNTDGIIELFVEEFEKSKVLLTGSDNVFDIKLAQLAEQAKLTQATQLSNEQVEQAIATVVAMLETVDNNLSYLQQEVFDFVGNGQMITIITLLVSIGASVVIAFITIRAMITPLTRINHILNDIANGNLSKQLNVESEDEYGQLSNNVNSVVSHLKALIAEIGQNSSALNLAANQSENELQSVAVSLGSQQETVSEMTDMTQALSSNADDVLAKSGDAEQQMTDALSRSNELKSQANSTAGKISNLSGLLDGAAERMAVLNQEATNISSILETIQSIADQTNLLALNAAIEAARAGEAGRGFSVVADEVRMLASRTQESTAEINAMIESLQQQTGSVVSDIEQGKSGAQDCHQDTQQLLSTLSSISVAIEQMHSLSGDISAAAHQQNDLSNNINASIIKVSDVSQQSSERSNTTLTYSQEVASLAKQLESAVDAFTVR